jgi:chromosome segregation ATPase
MPAETIDEAFSRGQTQGEVNARLDNHAQRLNAHDSAIAQIGPQMANLTTAIQELRADLRGREDTAKALLDADERRRKELDAGDEQRRKRADEARKALDLADEDRAKKAARKALPITKGLAYLAAFEGVVVTYLAYLRATGKG